MLRVITEAYVEVLTTVSVCVSICPSDLFILDLQRRQAGLELCEAQGELRLDLRLGGDLGHLTGSGKKEQDLRKQKINTCRRYVLGQ